MAERDRDNVYFATMAIASVVMGAIGVALTLALRSVSPAAGLGSEEIPPPSGLSVNVPKVHYQDNEYLVSVRDPGEWHELREFIQPTNPNVLRIVGNIYG